MGAVEENANKLSLLEVDWCMGSKPGQMPCPDDKDDGRVLMNVAFDDPDVNTGYAAAMNNSDYHGLNLRGSYLPEKGESR